MLESLQAETGAPAMNEPPILQIRVHNSRHRASVPFDDRSRGFVWFFSFLAYLNELEADANAPGYANAPTTSPTGEHQDQPGYYDPEYPVATSTSAS